MTKNGLDELLKRVRWKSLLAIAARYGPPGTAEDAVQTAVATALEIPAMDAMNPTAQDRYFMKIVKSKAIDLWKKAHRTASDAIIESVPAASAQPADRDTATLMRHLDGLLDNDDLNRAILDVKLLPKLRLAAELLPSNAVQSILHAAWICAVLGEAPLEPEQEELAEETRSFADLFADATAERNLGRRYQKFRIACLRAVEPLDRRRAWVQVYWLHPIVMGRGLNSEDRSYGHAWGVALGLFGALLNRYARKGRSTKKLLGAAKALLQAATALVRVCGSPRQRAPVPRLTPFRDVIDARKALRRVAAGLMLIGFAHHQERLQRLSASEDGPPDPAGEKESA